MPSPWNPVGLDTSDGLDRWGGEGPIEIGREEKPNLVSDPSEVSRARAQHVVRLAPAAPGNLGLGEPVSRVAATHGGNPRQTPEARARASANDTLVPQRFGSA